MIEAKTGVGKTLGYLVPTMLMVGQHGGRAVVSTYTKALQPKEENVALRRRCEDNYSSAPLCAVLLNAAQFLKEEPDDEPETGLRHKCFAKPKALLDKV